jgi:hypothetical protein
LRGVRGCSDIGPPKLLVPPGGGDVATVVGGAPGPFGGTVR